MSTQTTDTSVQASIVVEAPIERAFKIFAQEMASWWPPDHHILRGELSEMVLEPWVGGAIYDRLVDGRTCRWSRVLAYEPPNRVVFSWDISLRWEIETDPSKTSEVEVRFTAEGPDRTQVVLQHCKLERHGGGWEQMRDAVGSPEGWGVGLQRFAAAAKTG